MTRISVSYDALTVEIRGLHQLWALTKRIRVPLAHVRGATADPGIVHEPKGLRAPGVHVPGSAVIGTFHRDGEKHFWDVRSGAHAVVIELTGEVYDRLIVDVENPRGTVDMINRAVHGLATSGTPTVDPPQPAPRFRMTGPRWKAALAVAVVVEGVLKTAMLIDVGHRPPQALHGSKRLWRVLAFVNFFGPLAYFTVGRRHAPTAPHPPKR